MNEEFTEIFPKREPLEDEILCPYDNIAYRNVPGYRDGYGCPICKGVGSYHLPILKEQSIKEND